MKKYRLLKDLPGIKAGTIYEYRNASIFGLCTDYDYCLTETKLDEIEGKNNHGQFIRVKIMDVAASCDCFQECFIKSHPDWFEEVQESKFTKEDMIDFGNSLCGNRYETKGHFNAWLQYKNK